MGIDLLDIVYRLEKRFSIRIDRENFTGPMEEWEATAKEGRQQEFLDQYADRLTVRFLCDIVEQKIRKQNEGKSDFPDMLSEARISVHRELARLFGTVPDAIQDELTLKQTAEHVMPDLPFRFWRQFYRSRSTDPLELKAIKKQIRSSQLISGWTTLTLASCLTALLLFILLLVFLFATVDISGGLVAALIFVLWTILCGRRWIVNRIRHKQAPNLTVGDLITGLADQRPDRSVRADGLPYTQEEILEGVTETLCEALPWSRRRSRRMRESTKTLGPNSEKAVFLSKRGQTVTNHEPSPFFSIFVVLYLYHSQSLDVKMNRAFFLHLFQLNGSCRSQATKSTVFFLARLSATR